MERHSGVRNGGHVANALRMGFMICVNLCENAKNRFNAKSEEQSNKDQEIIK